MGQGFHKHLMVVGAQAKRERGLNLHKLRVTWKWGPWSPVLSGCSQGRLRWLLGKVKVSVAVGLCRAPVREDGAPRSARPRWQRRGLGCAVPGTRSLRRAGGGRLWGRTGHACIALARLGRRLRDASLGADTSPGAGARLQLPRARRAPRSGPAAASGSDRSGLGSHWPCLTLVSVSTPRLHPFGPCRLPACPAHPQQKGLFQGLTSPVNPPPHPLL